MFIIDFSDARCADRRAVGGKATNLGALTQAGFPVPRGFVVSNEAYDAFVGAELRARIREVITAVDYTDADKVEFAAKAVRALITAADMPANIESEIAAAYTAFGADSLVAVRSSGTAEDLADASFAGQHDTYLDMRGIAVVLDAVKRCWASLWTARAIAYRHAHGFDHFTVSLAVVIQEMVEADVAGVMFTANPLTQRTDEIVINASWGLGEGVVSGILMPDEFTLDKKTARITNTVVGQKEVRVIRNPHTGRGVITEPVPAELRSATTLDASQLAELAALGRQVERHYGGMPQDIEWAFAQGRFYLLQARDITGVHFTWDEDVDAWQTLPDEEDVIWSRSFADEFWTGAVTPLFYSVRAREFTESFVDVARIWGFEKLAKTRRFKYHKAEAYISTRSQEHYVKYTVPKQFRPGPALDYFPPSMKADAANWPFSKRRYVWMHARILRAPDQRMVKWMDIVQDYIDNRVPEGNGLGVAELRRLSDEELKKYIAERIKFAHDLLHAMWSGFIVHGAAALYFLGEVLSKWYDGTNKMIFSDLITGLPKRTITLEENLALWDLADEIRRSPELLALFESSGEDVFFERLRQHAAGRSAARKYDRFIEEHGHRGHADRDFWFTRRAEDPTLDYRALKTILTSAADSPRPDEREHKLAKVREDATAELMERLRRRSFGALRVRLLKAVLAYVHRFLVLRDDERDYIDRVTFSKKRAFEEVGRRLLERGLLEHEGDHYFLTETELFEVFENRAPMRLIHAKGSGRRKQFESFHAKKYLPPLYLRAGKEYREEQENAAISDGSRLLTGFGTSRGSVTGPARVVRELKDIGRIKAGDILITNSTDPGWTPVFVVISGLVLETGGMLAHGSCLSREYGLPAVMLANATNLIEDGDIITIDGETGRVQLPELDQTQESTHAVA